MSKIPHRFFLSEEEMPKQWYNLRADMKQLPDPMLNPRNAGAGQGRGPVSCFLQGAGQARAG